MNDVEFQKLKDKYEKALTLRSQINKLQGCIIPLKNKCEPLSVLKHNGVYPGVLEDEDMQDIVLVMVKRVIESKKKELEAL